MLGVLEIAPGLPGAPFTVIQRGEPVPQLFVAETHNDPEVNVPKSTIIELLPFPVITAPDGAVQLYVAPFIIGHVYVCETLHNPVVWPVIEEGFSGNPDLMVLHFGGVVVPQIVVEDTQILPLATKLGPKVTVILFVVEKPLTPIGKVQLYVTTPGCDGTLYVNIEFEQAVKVPDGA